ncbi:MAG: UDP-N-acetylmuramoyl-tripeptide--D-alanyl-D-alanine ligase, partial [Phycicoccus sp.]
MIPMSLAAVAEATGGRVVGAGVAVLVDGTVTTDSREVGPGGLFVARSGEHADGHDFVLSAVHQGAVAALVERPVPGVPCVLADDTERAFGRLARAVVDALPELVVVGITGSSGKTTTKDLLGAVLGSDAPTVAPVGSYNSEVGVPLTVCRVRPDTRYLVAEMGARGVGHIAHLTRVAPPRIGVVLNVGSAHLGEFGSREAIGRAKSELVAALPADGLAVLNADDDIVRHMAAVTSARVVLVGESADADLRASEVELDANGRARFL